jgi:hypothetical protein
MEMKPLDGWEGPVSLAKGVYRYSKNVTWIRLYIDVEGQNYYGGTVGAPANFEIEIEGDKWMRFETDLAQTPKGELVLRLRGLATWDVVYERISEGCPIDERIGCIEDLAAYLERCFA